MRETILTIHYNCINENRKSTKSMFGGFQFVLLSRNLNCHNWAVHRYRLLVPSTIEKDVSILRRTYVPIFQDKKDNNHIFFDYELNEFFTTPQQKSSSIVYLSGFVGIVFYSFFKNVSIDVGLNPFAMVLLSIILGVTIGFISLKIMMNVINKSLAEKKIVLTLTKEQVREYIYEGKKQFKATHRLIMFLLFLSLFSSSFFLLMPHNLVMFLANIVFWAVLIILIWGVRPIKRRQVINQLIKEL